MADSTINFTEIRPAEFDDQFYRLDLLHAMDSWAQDAIKEFNKTTEFWDKSRRPVFTRSLSTVADGRTKISITVSTTDPVYNWLVQGVSAHPIKKVKDFKSGTWGLFKAGSLPGTLRVRQGGKVKIKGNGEFYLSLNWEIPWPGIKARNYYELVRHTMEVTPRSSLQYRLQSALNKAVTKAYKASSASFEKG